MKLRPLKCEKVIKVLKKMGFEEIRQKGSHLFFKHPDGRTTVVPIHKNEEIGRGLLADIIKDTKLSKNEFMKMVGET
jgi:predicted RNA binding protein YcfA (HicA-like mRNA interferase family)